MWYFSASHFFQYPPVDAKSAEVDLKEDFEDTKGAIRFRISRKNRQHNDQKSTKVQTTINKTYL
jgi:type II secretory pathway component PulL